jgi:hypothetical protein
VKLYPRKERKEMKGNIGIEIGNDEEKTVDGEKPYVEEINLRRKRRLNTAKYYENAMLNKDTMTKI